MKGRLINEAEILLSYNDGKYFERTDAGAAFESKAPLKAEIINQYLQSIIRLVHSVHIVHTLLLEQ